MQVKEMIRKPLLRFTLWVLARLDPISHARELKAQENAQKLKEFEEALNRPIHVPENIKTGDYVFTEAFSEAHRGTKAMLVDYCEKKETLDNPMGADAGENSGFTQLPTTETQIEGLVYTKIDNGIMEVSKQSLAIASPAEVEVIKADMKTELTDEKKAEINEMFKHLVKKPVATTPTSSVDYDKILEHALKNPANPAG